MRCQFLTLLLLSSTAAFVAPVAPARPQHVVRAEKEGEAVAKKKGIPLALLIWPLIAVGDDVRARADTSIRHRRERGKARTGRSPRADLRLASPAAPRGAGHRDSGAALLQHELPQEVSFIHCLQGRGRRRRRAVRCRSGEDVKLVNHTGLDHRPRRVARRYRSERRPWRRP